MSDFGSLVFYIVLFCLSGMMIAKVGKLYKKQEEKINDKKFKIVFLTIIGLAIPILIGAIRYYVGTDYEAYIYIYDKTIVIPFGELIMQKTEVLFSIIIKIISIFNDPQVMFGVMSFLTVIIFYISIFNYKEKLSLGFMFFLYLFIHFTSSFNLIKQAIAAVIIVYSYKFIFEKNVKKFIIVVLIASMFHISALLFLPFYFINNKRNLIKGIYIIGIIIVVLNYQSILKILSSFSVFEEYQTYQKEVESANREAILEFAILGVILLFRKQLIKYDEKNKIFILLSIINSIILLTGYISPFVKRIAMYFGMSNIFLLATFPNLAKNKEQKLFIYFIIATYAIGRFVIITYVLKQAHIIPYQTIFR